MIINYYNPLPFPPRWLRPDENNALVSMIYPRGFPAGFHACGLHHLEGINPILDLLKSLSPPSHSLSHSPFPAGFPALPHSHSVVLCLFLALCCGASWGFFCVLPTFLPSFLPFPADEGSCSSWCSAAPPGSPADPEHHPEMLGRERSFLLPQNPSHPPRCWSRGPSAPGAAPPHPPTKPFALTWLPGPPEAPSCPLALHLPPARPPPQVLRGGQTSINQISATPS